MEVVVAMERRVEVEVNEEEILLCFAWLVQFSVTFDWLENSLAFLHGIRA